MQLPIQQLPVLSSPTVFKLLCVHATNFIKIRLINSKQAKAIHFPVACEWKSKISDIMHFDSGSQSEEVNKAKPPSKPYLKKLNN